MKAIDSNVLLRRLLDDDAALSARARDLFDGATPILVTDVVLVETLWTLRSKRYRASKEDIVAVVSGLLDEPNVVFENEQAVWSALNDLIDAPSVRCPDGLRSADFADALVVAKARATIEQLGEPYEATYTSDVAAQSLHGTKPA